MKTLFVVNGRGYPENDSGISKIICNLARTSKEKVDLLMYGKKTESNDVELFSREYQLEPAVSNQGADNTKKLFGLFFSSQCSEDYLSRTGNKSIANYLNFNGRSYSRIIFFGSNLSSISLVLSEDILNKIVFFPIDNKIVFFERKLARAGFFSAIYCYIQIVKLRLEFKRCYKKYASIVFVSSADLEAYNNLVGPSKQSKLVLANGVVLNQHNSPLNSVHLNKIKGMLFLHGDFSYSPNIEAVENIISVKSALEKLGYTFSVKLVGKHSNNFHAVSNNIYGTGFVKDIYEFLPSFGLYVCVQNTGAGIKNKLLEAFASGMVVLSNDVAMTGIAAIGGHHYIDVTRMTVFEIAEIIVNLSDEEMNAYSLNGYKLVESEYSWERASDLLANSFREVK